MKSSVTIRCIGLVLFSALCASAPVCAQTCSNDAGTIACTDDRQESCSVTGDGKFFGKCFDPNAQMLMSGDKDEADAEYASQVTGQRVTAQELRNDPKLREGLESGRIRMGDGRVVTFTPVGEVRKKISQRSVDSRLFARPATINEFGLRSSLNQTKTKVGRAEAIRQYVNLLGNPLVKTPVILDELAAELLSEKDFAGAIQLLELNVKIKHDAAAFFALARAHQIKYEVQRLEEDRAKALTNFERVLAEESNPSKLRAESLRQTRTLRGGP